MGPVAAAAAENCGMIISNPTVSPSIGAFALGRQYLGWIKFEALAKSIPIYELENT
jgi:hypothetical protein